MEIRLMEQDWPLFGPPPEPVGVTANELEDRLRLTQQRMDERKFSHLLIYGDREHFANLWWLTDFDPRFEEAALILRREGTPLLLVGNECKAYLAISPLLRAGSLRWECYQPFSLMNQPRDNSRDLLEILAAEGVGGGSRVGCVGSKSYGSPHAMDIPSYLVDAARSLAGHQQVECAADLFVDPGNGLRARCGSTEIAMFERSNWKTSEAMKRVLGAIREGSCDSELLEAAQYDGTPLSCHMTCKTGPNRISLASPRGNLVERGYPWSANIGYWGSNICRAGWVAETEADLPNHALGYLNEFVKPYFRAMAAWFQLLRIGTPGGQIESTIQRMLPFEKFGVFLNAGHLIHGEEWLSSPIYSGSSIPIASGMVMQSDVIPASGRFGSTRMEDGYAIVGEVLLEELGERFPACLARCESRQRYMENELGIPVPREVLPLSNLCGMVMPFVLKPNLVLTARSE